MANHLGTPTASDAAVAVPPDLDTLLAHVHGLTRATARALGMNAMAAEQAARDGALLLDGKAVMLCPVPLEAGGGSKLVVSVASGLKVREMSSAALIALLAHAPGLLSVHGVTIGCDPHGVLTLYRSVDAMSASSESLMQEMLTTHHLALLLLQGASTPKEQ